jgi:hypothetical protein
MAHPLYHSLAIPSSPREALGVKLPSILPRQQARLCVSERHLPCLAQWGSRRGHPDLAVPCLRQTGPGQRRSGAKSAGFGVTDVNPDDVVRVGEIPSGIADWIALPARTSPESLWCGCYCPGQIEKGP